MKNLTSSAVIENEGMSESEFAACLPDLEKSFLNIRVELVNAAAMLGRMSAPQLREVKTRYSRLMSSDHIERLALMGREQMAKHLAVPEKSIRASLFKILSKNDRAKLNDPDHVVQVMTRQRILTKPVKDLTPVEFSQVVCPRRGILSGEQQTERVMKSRGKKKNKVYAKAARHADVFDCLVPSETSGCVIIYGKPSDGSGSRTSAIEVSLDQLKKLIGSQLPPDRLLTGS